MSNLSCSFCAMEFHMQTLCGGIVTAVQWGSLTSLNGLNMSSSISVNCRKLSGNRPGQNTNVFAFFQPRFIFYVVLHTVDSRVVGVQLHSPLSMVLLTCIT